MEKPSNSKAQQEVKQILQNINHAWTKGNIDDIEQWFHEDIVIAAPNGQIVGEGREACIRSYRDFCSNAKVTDFKEAEPDIRVCGNTAVASYIYEISWEMAGKMHNEKGREIFVFNRDGDTWLGVWRTVITL